MDGHRLRYKDLWHEFASFFGSLNSLGVIVGKTRRITKDSEFRAYIWIVDRLRTMGLGLS